MSGWSIWSGVHTLVGGSQSNNIKTDLSSAKSSWFNMDSSDPRTPSPGYDNTWSHALKPQASYIFATCYLSFLCVVAVIMCARSRTRLRVFACFITYLGLTIAALGLLHSKYLISANWFWAWNFTAESSGVIVLAFIIVSVGSGFYPMARHRNLYWRMSMGVIIFYSCIAIANVAYYVQQKIAFHSLSGAEVQQLRDKIISVGLFTAEELKLQRIYEQSRNLIPMGDAALTGVKDWRELAWSEREMFARPVAGIYLGHQLITLLTCMWVCIYLFIPLVLHHRQGPIDRPVDSDMMAVGVWYLSSLMTLAFAYACLQASYCLKHEMIYEPQTQVLDLCLRITLGPIFFLPAPPWLLRFYRERFQRFKGNGAKGRNGSGGSGQNWGSGNNMMNGSITNSQNCSGGNATRNSDVMRMGRRLGSAGSSYPRDSFDYDADIDIWSNYPETAEGGKGRGSNFGRIKVFPTRDRELSAESSRVLNRDFECDDSNSQHLSMDRRESPHQYCLNVDSQDLNYYHQPSRNSSVLDEPLQDEPLQDGPLKDETKISETYDPLHATSQPRTTQPRIVDTTRKLKPIITEEQMQTIKMPVLAAVVVAPITGTTGWEVGGFGLTKTDAETKSRHVDESTARISTSPEVGSHDAPVLADITVEATVEASVEAPVEAPVDAPVEAPVDAPVVAAGEELTGLQRQLAEHRSSLLPKVIAFLAYEDFAKDELFDPTFKPSAIPYFDFQTSHPGTSEYRISRGQSSRRSEEIIVPNSTLSSSTLKADIDSGAEPNCSRDIGPIHWSMSPESTKGKKGVEATLRRNSLSGASLSSGKSRDLISVFSKALHGGTHNNSRGSYTKDAYQGHSSRLSYDLGDYGLKIPSLNSANGSSDIFQGPVTATAAELAKLSADGANPYEYSDPYGDRESFKRAQERLLAGASLGIATTTLTDTKGLPTFLSSRSSSTPSLGLSKTRDSMTKGIIASKEHQTRPTSPPPKRSSSKLSLRSTRSSGAHRYFSRTAGAANPINTPDDHENLAIAATSPELGAVKIFQEYRVTICDD
ncbi:hypothetical protein BGZ98_010320 [Dissophora globulifera]|nr:hypothetical protein BGZ98_010320 [Dissophora globulifera]